MWTSTGLSDSIRKKARERNERPLEGGGATGGEEIKSILSEIQQIKKELGVQ